MDQQETEILPDNALITFRQAADMGGFSTNVFAKVIRDPKFPTPVGTGGKTGHAKLWLCADIKQWHATHCCYGNQNEACAEPRVDDDPYELHLCESHTLNAYRILDIDKETE